MLFSAIGGEFTSSYHDFVEKVNKIKLLVFDWDGVFNSGVKGDGVFSNFSEVDGMGINMFRFGFKLKFDAIPFTGVISGQKNKSTELFAKRERLNFICMGFKYKVEAFEMVINEFGVDRQEVAFIFDDVLDLSVAKLCGLRFLIRRNASPMFTNLVKNNCLADYITASCGETFAVREICELVLASIGNYDETIFHRTNYDDVYQNYLRLRNSYQLKTFTAPTLIN